MELTEFINARLDEDEAALEPFINPVGDAAQWHASDVGGIVRGRRGERVIGCDTHFDAEHIARHDPARVLATVEAHRKIVALFAPTLDDEMRAAAGEYDETAFRGDRALRALASIWSDHPDYDHAWEA